MKKFISCILAAVMVTGSISAFASETKELTIADAVKFTIASDTSYLNLLDTGTLNAEGRTDALNNYYDNWGMVDDGSDWLKTEVQLMQYDAKLALQSSNEKQKQLILQNTLTRYFMNIITAEKSLALSNLALENKKADLNILSTKARLGLVSQSEYNASLADFEKSKNDIVLKEKNIVGAYTELNRLMSKPIHNRYTLILDFKYRPIEDINLDHKISRAISDSTSIKQKESDLEVARFRSDKAWVFSGSTQSTYTDVQIQATQARRVLDDAKENLRSAIITAYNDIKTLEVQISTNELELLNMQNQLAIKKVELRLGKITALDLKKFEYQIIQLEETLRQQKYNHALTAWQFENPEVL